MGSVAVLASGSGSNFQAICESLERSPHRVAGLVCDQEAAYVLRRAEALGIPAVVVPYERAENGRREAETRIVAAIRSWSPDLIALAGFMRILSPAFVDEFADSLVNIHPSLLPKYPGVNAIERSFDAGDPVVGITVHFVDHGVDTGRIITQESLPRQKGETLADLETRIHQLEHTIYPAVIQALLDNSRAGFAAGGPL